MSVSESDSTNGFVSTNVHNLIYRNNKYMIDIRQKYPTNDDLGDTILLNESIFLSKYFCNVNMNTILH